MARISFSSHFARHVDCPEDEVPGATVMDALTAYFARRPRVRSYVLDEQDVLRKHVVVFVDGVQARDRARLADPIADGAEIAVLQALSGG